jgi:pimeloyl-ACP methyl ester carboxylesterase
MSEPVSQTKQPRGPLITIVFIHGWLHNAQAGDPHVSGFHQALAALSQWNPGATIRGVYVGWRGASLQVPWLQNLTFWERKNVSDEVGRGGLYEFLWRLETIVKPSAASPNKLVLMGHSFGASVTFNALAGRYLTRFMEGLEASGQPSPVGRAGPGRRFRGYGDLVVLVNPAIEGMRYLPFHTALRYYAVRRPDTRIPYADFSDEVQPVLIILSAKGDWATRMAFPAARALSTLGETHRAGDVDGSMRDAGEYSQWKLDIAAMGNVEQFFTHETLTADKSLWALDKGCPALPDGELRRALRDPSGGKHVFPSSGVILQRRNHGMPYTPYWVMETDERISGNHGDIRRLELLCWVSQLMASR